MSIVKPDANNKLAPPRRPTHGRIKNPCRGTTALRYRLQRTVQPCRVLIIIVLVAAMLLDASVMRGFWAFFNQMATAIYKLSRLDFTNLIAPSYNC